MKSAAIHLEDFKAGEYRRADGYQYFLPSPINRPWTWNSPAIHNLLADAMLRLGELNAWARRIASPEMFIHMQAHAESWASNRIEGTRTTMNEALLPESAIAPDGRDDWQEIQNYTRALHEALDSDLPVASRLIKATHRRILQSVRGQHKNPGHYRTSQNWIGGSAPGNAHFVPPHHQHVDDLMGDLEKFINNDRIEVPPLVRIAMAHCQFETIHPFLDGNGRMGRLMIPVYLARAGVLHSPLFYMSGQLEKTRQQYYRNLDRVRTHNAMLQWLEYFLRASNDAARGGVILLDAMHRLKEESEQLIRDTFGRRANAGLRLLTRLFVNPVITTADTMQVCQMQYQPSRTLLQAMQKAGILQAVPGTARPRLYWFRSYLDIFGNR